MVKFLYKLYTYRFTWSLNWLFYNLHLFNFIFFFYYRKKNTKLQLKDNEESMRRKKCFTQSSMKVNDIGLKQQKLYIEYDERRITRI